jgi:cytochrome c553
MALRITRKQALAAMAAIFAFGLMVAWSGIVNIGASTGHWAITDWFLHWSMRNTVRTQAALTVDEPATDPAGLISAAGHYAANCAVCHGAPGERPWPVMRATTPPAPDLSVTARTWSDRQLFWIVKHGVKFTPMPAWPAQDRDDEVRRMAAFVRRLPDLSPAEYRTLAYGPGRIAGGKPMRLADALADCERCHADHGREQPDIPVLAGQRPAYLQMTLEAYASGRRASGVMGAAAARIGPGVLRALADHYADLPGLSEPEETIVAAAAPTAEDPLAERIVTRGLPEADLPACAQCHAAGKRPHYPVLSGQKPEYLVARLRRWRGDGNVVDARKSNAPMPMIARRIPERMIEPLARYYARRAAVFKSMGAER